MAKTKVVVGGVKGVRRREEVCARKEDMMENRMRTRQKGKKWKGLRFQEKEQEKNKRKGININISTILSQRKRNSDSE